MAAGPDNSFRQFKKANLVGVYATVTYVVQGHLLGHEVQL